MQILEQQKLNIMLRYFVSECITVYGDKLSDVKLFGSYARGDNCDGSDIDVMVILHLNDTEVRKNRHDMCRIAAMLDLKHNVNISPVLYSKREYDTRKTLGFCKNVELEGVSQYTGQIYK
jgi:predicted nucleotidyltransferase